jgi:hypothetical protein
MDSPSEVKRTSTRGCRPAVGGAVAYSVCGADRRTGACADQSGPQGHLNGYPYRMGAPLRSVPGLRSIRLM